MPANTFVASAEAVVLAGAVPRFADVEPGHAAAHARAAGSCHHPADRGRDRRSPLRSDARHGRPAPPPAGPGSSSSRTRRRPTGRAGAAGGPDPSDSRVASASTRARTSARSATPGPSLPRTRPGRPDQEPARSRPRPVFAVRARASRDQQPARRAAGGGADRQAFQARRVDRGAPVDRRSVPRGLRRRAVPAWSRRSRARGASTTSPSPGCQTARGSSGSWRRRGSRPRSTTRSRATGRPRTGVSHRAAAGRRDAPPAKCSRCRYSRTWVTESGGPGLRGQCTTRCGRRSTCLG